MKPRLVDLPTEILQIIFEGLEEKHFQLSVSLTCKRLYEAVLGSVYKKVVLSDLRIADGLAMEGPDVQAIMRTFLENPHLCKHVKVLRLNKFSALGDGVEGGMATPSRSRMPYDRLSPEGAAKLRDLCRRFAEYELIGATEYALGADGWFTEEGVQEDALVGVLLTLLPALEELYMTVPRNSSFWMIGFFHAGLGTPWPSNFPHLRTIGLHLYDTGDLWFGRDCVRGCLALPTLEKLCLKEVFKHSYSTDQPGGVNYVDIVEDSDSKYSGPYSAKLVHLEVRDTTFKTEHLDWIFGRLESCTLQTLILRFKFESLWGYMGIVPAPLDWNRLCFFLERLRPPLRRLEVTDKSAPSNPFEVIKILSCLNMLECLKLSRDTYIDMLRWVKRKRRGALETDETDALGSNIFSIIDALPPDIQSMELTRFGALDSEDLELLNLIIDGGRSGSLPRLRQIILRDIKIDWIAETLEFCYRPKANLVSLDPSDGIRLGVGQLPPGNLSLVPRRAGLTRLYHLASRSGIQLEMIGQTVRRFAGFEPDHDVFGLEDQMSFEASPAPDAADV